MFWYSAYVPGSPGQAWTFASNPGPSVDYSSEGMHSFRNNGVVYSAKGRIQPRQMSALLNVRDIISPVTITPFNVGANGNRVPFDEEDDDLFGPRGTLIANLLANFSSTGEKQYIHDGTDFATGWGTEEAANLAWHFCNAHVLTEISDELFVPKVQFGKNAFGIGVAQTPSSGATPGNPWSERGVAQCAPGATEGAYLSDVD
jgi:hypothetical protein